MKNYYRVSLLLMLCNFYSLNSYAQTCLKDLDLKGPVKSLTYQTAWPVETPDGYKYKGNRASFFTAASFPLNISITSDNDVLFDTVGRITTIYDCTWDGWSGRQVESRTDFLYKNDRLDRIIYSNSPEMKTGTGIDAPKIRVWVKYDAHGEMTDLYRRYNDNRHYRYSKTDNGNINISEITQYNEIIEVGRIEENEFQIKVGQDSLTLPYMLNPLSINIYKDMYDYKNLISRANDDMSYILYITGNSNKMDVYGIQVIAPYSTDAEIGQTVLLGNIEYDDNGNIVKLNVPALFDDNSYYYEYKGYDKYGNWLNCFRYVEATGIQDFAIFRRLTYYEN